MYLGLMRETWRQYLEQNPPPALTPFLKKPCAVRRPFRVRMLPRTG